MLNQLKRATLKSLKACGGFRLIERSNWRRQRLLILAYHGISLADEHLWDGYLFMSPAVFRARLQLLKASGCRVLPLGEALRRLDANDLPDKCVALTFDDGTFDFYRAAFPLLQEFGYPVTLYLTTFYAQYNRPVFNVICSYLLWKGRDQTLRLKDLTGADAQLALSSGAACAAAFTAIQAFVTAQQLSAEEKDALARALARQLKIDYDALLAQRLLHILKPEEVRQLAAAGVDVQLHTHRHRTPLDPALFRREIEDNRNAIQAMTGTSPTHFCYPSGVYDPAFLPWLAELGIVSATTCDVGLVTAASPRLLLPRVLDTSLLTAIEFEGWLTGASTMFPRHPHTIKQVAA